jgi:hypothetical protein
MGFAGTVVPRWEDRILRDAMAFFREVRGDDEYARREAEIAAAPVVEWKGKTLRTLRCNGTTGKGPHDVHLAESRLWCLIDLRSYRCAYH